MEVIQVSEADLHVSLPDFEGKIQFQVLGWGLNIYEGLKYKITFLYLRENDCSNLFRNYLEFLFYFNCMKLFFKVKQSLTLTIWYFI